jgi:elongator complex protein 1
MRNLKKIEHSTVRHSQDLPLTAITWDTNTTSLICAFGPYAGKPFIRLQKWRAIGKKAGEIDADFRTIVSWDVPSPSPDLVVDRVLSLQHFGDDGTICLVFEGGDVVLVREERPSGQEEVEIVGSVDTGISAARWSPDEELLALLTKAGNVMFMTRHFDSVGETAMKDDDLASSKHVSVGWGSAATQFKGKRAKALQDPTIPQKVDEGRLSPCDKGQFQISWRGDGAFVAVSSISTSKSRDRRVIRVYDRECKLDSVSEPVDGLEGALSWRPAGNLIASIQRFNDHIDVVFFERNGLRHGEFTLQISPEGLDSWATTIDLAWNTDSTVLAVSYQDRIQLWTMGNYHYYLKQEIHVPAKQKWPLYTSVTWNPSLPLRLAISSPGWKPFPCECQVD